MQKLLLLALTLISLTATASDCSDTVKKYYYSSGHEYIEVTETSITRALELLSSFEISSKQKIQKLLNTSSNTTLFKVSSEYYSGYGLDIAFVNKSTCYTFDILNIYSE